MKGFDAMKRQELLTLENNMEEMILEKQESIADDCHTCSYKKKCNNQCMKIEKHYNQMLERRED